MKWKALWTTTLCATILLAVVDHSCALNRSFARRGAGHFQRDLPRAHYTLEMAFAKGDCEYPPDVGPYADRRSVLVAGGTIRILTNGVELATLSSGRYTAGGGGGDYSWNLASFWVESDSTVDVYFTGDIAELAAHRRISTQRSTK